MWWRSSTLGGMGQIFQNALVLSPDVLPPPGIDACVSPENSQARKAASAFAVASTRWVALAPQDLHLHLWPQALVLPFRLVSPPQRGQVFVLVACRRPAELPRPSRHGLAGRTRDYGHALFPPSELGRVNLLR